MSVPDFTGDVRRATRLVVAGTLPGSGTQVEIATDAFEARALQHELDHVDGLLFLDRVAGAHAIHPPQTYQGPPPQGPPHLPNRRPTPCPTTAAVGA